MKANPLIRKEIERLNIKLGDAEYKIDQLTSERDGLIEKLQNKVKNTSGKKWGSGRGGS